MEQRQLILIFLIVCVLVPMVLYKPLRADLLDEAIGRRAFDVYLINLDQDKGRLKAFKHVYDQCDLSRMKSFIRHAATDGRTLDIKSLVTPKAYGEIRRAEQVKYRSKHYELTRGAVGCWMSHTRLWKQFLETDKDVALIFEDDCVMVTDLHQQLQQTRPPKDWDILLLGYVCNRCSNQENGDAIKVHRFFGLHCYVINRKFVKKFFDSPHSRTIGKQIDSVLSDMIAEGSLNVYAARKKVAWQNNRHATRIQMPIKITPGVDVWATD